MLQNLFKFQNSKFYTSGAFFQLSVIIILTILIYSTSIFNDFVAWDDNVYVTDNALIKDLSFIGIKNMFTSFYFGIYHPITWLTLSLNYYFFKLNPLPYHLTNLVLHLLNTLLVYIFFRLLSGKYRIAVMVSALFAVHPMHVETVAWIADMKDLLYSFFLLIALIFYIRYLKTCLSNVSASKGILEKITGHFDLNYFFTILFFIFSLLSKPSAVIFPGLLFLIDYKFERKLDLIILLDKIPFVLFSIIFFILNVYANQILGPSIVFHTNFIFINRIFFTTYSILFYLLKLFIPDHLCAFYSMPAFTVNVLPFLYYFSLIIIPIIILFILKLKKNRDVMFGFYFFLIALFVVCPFVWIGIVLVADRYTYLPYLGLFYIIAILFYKYIGNQNFRYKSLSRIIITCLILVLSLLTYGRTKIWKNTITLFSDAINKNPDSYTLYFNRGTARMKTNDSEGAINDFSKAISLTPVINQVELYKSFYNRGIVYKNIGKYGKGYNRFQQGGLLSSILS